MALGRRPLVAGPLVELLDVGDEQVAGTPPGSLASPWRMIFRFEPLPLKAGASGKLRGTRGHLEVRPEAARNTITFGARTEEVGGER